MKDVVYITGNQSKADYLARLLAYPIEHVKVDLPEIQSLDVRAVVDEKLEAAYKAVGRPVLVEDTALEFTALGRLPGTFIKFFIEELGFQGLCDLITGEDRSATGRCVFGYYDGKEKIFFASMGTGTIAKTPAKSGGFGWDQIYIPDGYLVTRAELPPEDHDKDYLTIKPIDKVREFLQR